MLVCRDKRTQILFSFQVIFIIGLLLMVLGTYVNLYEADSKAASKVSEPNVLPSPNIDRIPDLVKEDMIVNVDPPEVEGEAVREPAKVIENEGQ